MIGDRNAAMNRLIVDLTTARDKLFVAFQEASRLQSAEADADYSALRQHVADAHGITADMLGAVELLGRPPG